MVEDVPIIETAPVYSYTYDQILIEGWSRAGIQSYWRLPSWNIAFDVGALPWRFIDTDYWFISHAHLDHMAMLPILNARRWMMGRKPPKIIVPKEIVPAVEQLFAAWIQLDEGSQECELIGVEPGDRVEVDHTRFVSVHRTFHAVPSRGYLIWERRKKLKPEYHSLTGPRLKQLKESGVTLSEEVPFPLLAYTGDTHSGVFEANPDFYRAKILICEVTLCHPEHDRSKMRIHGHTHLEDIVELADRFQNERLILGHFTAKNSLKYLVQRINELAPAHLLNRLVVWGLDEEKSVSIVNR